MSTVVHASSPLALSTSCGINVNNSEKTVKGRAEENTHLSPILLEKKENSSVKTLSVDIQLGEQRIYSDGCWVMLV